MYWQEAFWHLGLLENTGFDMLRYVRMCRSQYHTLDVLTGTTALELSEKIQSVVFITKMSVDQNLDFEEIFQVKCVLCSIS